MMRPVHVVLSFKFAMLVMVAGIIVFGLYLAWSFQTQNAAVEGQVLAEARVLNREMDAAWDYIDSIQNQINYTDGTYDFKKVYCSVAGKSIALRFTSSTDYTIRYARENPRSSSDEPDEFERRALRSFQDDGRAEYYEITEFDGKPSFRYASSLLVDYGCLRCHGEPAGAYDETGFIKEGMELGDLAGATSIVIPLERYTDSAARGIVQASVFFCLLMTVVTAIIWFALRRWVTDPMIADNERLHSENEAQSNFLAVISHELRTPLSSIIAFTDIWKRTVRSKGGEEERLVEEVEANSRLLLEMVDNTLDMARLDAGKLEICLAEVDVADVVNAVKTVASPLARKKGIAFSSHVATHVPVVTSDQEALHKILMNLVGNAIKFTDSGGRVHVEVSYEHEVLSFAVSDTGIGIASHNLDAVFNRFVRLQVEPVREEHGTGLGLSLVKTFTEMLSGTVEVKSTVGCGSVFSVHIPAPPFVCSEGRYSEGR